MREDTREGESHCDRGVKFSGFWVKERVSMEEVPESESKTATTAKRSKAEMGGSQRTESMYLDCGNLWILGGSESAVPIAMAEL